MSIYVTKRPPALCKIFLRNFIRPLFHAKIPPKVESTLYIVHTQNHSFECPFTKGPLVDVQKRYRRKMFQSFFYLGRVSFIWADTENVSEFLLSG